MYAADSTGRHQLAIPLPQAYEHAPREGYSFFRATKLADLDSEEYAALNTYLDDLVRFLTDTRLIQRHPEKFFQYIRGEEWRTTAMHLDHEAVTREELAYTLRLCNAFKPLFAPMTPSASPQQDVNTVADDLVSDASPTVMETLRDFVRCGPPATDPGGEGVSDGLQALQTFFRTSQRLMLDRKRRPRNDAARATLRWGNLSPPIATTDAAGEMDSGSATNASAAEEAEDELRKQRVLQLVLSVGMSPKKRHEVEIMRGAIADLVACCRSPCGSPTAAGCPQTVINIGEGKGYVSRAVALCDGLQVVGVDCNPAHKERAVQRVEGLLETSISARSDRRGRHLVNLLYTRRGHVASVVCRLGPHVRWDELLRGHVRTIDDASHVVTEMVDDGREGGGDGCDGDVDDPDSPWSSAAETRTNVIKTRCKVCQRVVRATSSVLLLKHASAHLSDFPDTNPARLIPGVPTRAQVDEWNVTLSQQQYAQRIIASFYTPLSRVGGRDSESAVVDGALMARPSQSTEVPDEALAEVGVKTLLLPRGSRALLRRQWVQAADPVWVTVVGFNDSTGEHLLVADEEGRRDLCQLYCPVDSFVARTGTGADAYPRVQHAPWWRSVNGGRNALVLRVLPFTRSLTPLVAVPSLRNTVMIGLHPCGDLGSNVCRHFLRTQSQALLLVSCCWHALTGEGFPLSTALRRRGMATEKVSLLLATQPLDMWATASAEGHKSSAKLLFFRSLLGLLWAEWAKAYESAESSRTHGCIKGCGFAPVPALEPAFLRKVARVKNTLTFRGFAEMVLSEYILAESAKTTAYTWQQQVCAACRATQEVFLRGPAAAEVLRGVAERYCRVFFGPFLGLTVLRMWMCHLVESLLLLDRALFLHETLVADGECGRGASSSAVSLVPLFDGAISPRMYGIFARRAE